MAKPPPQSLAATTFSSSPLVTILRPCLCFLLIVSNFPSNASSQAAGAAADEEKQILLQLKAAWGGPASLSSWTNSSSSSSHCSGWNGVDCGRDGSVVSITLVQEGIVGGVPPAVCRFQNLSSLNLCNNSLGGHFPTVLYDCSNLQSLNLSWNRFVGGIPDDVDRLSRRLRVLDLSNNNFSGDVTAALTRISGLRLLKLDNNHLNGTFTGELGAMAELEHLALGFNPFAPTRIPPELGNLKKLKYLWISKASLIGGIPATLGNLTELEHLDLASNGLTGTIPGRVWELEKLQNLYLFDNQLSGGIGGPVFRAFNLTEIDLSQNNLTGPIPDDFGKLLRLRILFLFINKLSGEIPADIGRISTLFDIRLFDNSLTGVLPQELGSHSVLINLEVDGNDLRGALPENLCAGRALNSLVAFRNGFTGVLPESLFGCETLMTLMVYYNGLSGDIPTRFWSLPKMTTVMLEGNSLSGELPEALPPTLSRLEIGHNRFSGKVPSSAPSLVVFTAGNNSFSGEIPSNLTRMTQLQVLSLQLNQISGEIPAGIGSLSGLVNLNLSGNRLSGSIPGEIGSLPALTSLDLSGNQLSGGIPAEMGMLRLNSLNLSSNGLTGQVPPALQIQAHNGSFLSNSGLCSSNPVLNLPACGRTKAGGSNGLPRGLLTLFLVLGILFVLMFFVLGFHVMRKLRRRKSVADRSSWKLTSFQPLDFTESNVVRGLTTENLIGNGGFGQVYRVPVRSGAVVAVKKIWSSRKVESRLEREFQAEVKILSSIRHANIIKLLCCVSGTDAKLLVYEYMYNGSLHRWLHEQKLNSAVNPAAKEQELDWPRRLRVAVGAASGLCYMHHDCSPPVVHRDVKSSNILLDLEFRPKVADFGLARMLAGGSLETDTGSAVTGSFGYMAPECAYSRKVSEKMDVYSFGVVLLELVTGKQASDGGDGQSCLAEWAWRHFQEGRPVVEAFDERIRDALYLEEMTAVLRLGLICTGMLSSTRPSMKDVLQVLTGCAGKHGFQNKSSVLEYDVAPPLRDARKKNSQRTGRSAVFDDDREEEKSLASNV